MQWNCLHDIRPAETNKKLTSQQKHIRGYRPETIQ